MVYSKADYEKMLGTQEKILEKIPSFRGCLYGPSGAGKTAAAAAIMTKILPEGKGALHIDVAENWATLHNHPENAKKIRTQPFTTTEDLEILAEMIFDKYGKFKNFGGIILDEASTMSGMTTDKIHQDRGGDSLVPEWPDYNASLAAFRRVIAAFSVIPDFHIILIAHEAQVKVKDRIIWEAMPAFSPKIAQKIKEPMHLVARLTSTTKKDFGPDGQDIVVYERKAQVHPLLKFDAKTRLPFKNPVVDTEKLPRAIEAWIQRGATLMDNPEPVEAPPEVTGELIPVETSEQNLEDLSDSESESLDEFAV